MPRKRKPDLSRITVGPWGHFRFGKGAELIPVNDAEYEAESRKADKEGDTGRITASDETSITVTVPMKKRKRK